jgi:hypothetical protein
MPKPTVSVRAKMGFRGNWHGVATATFKTPGGKVEARGEAAGSTQSQAEGAAEERLETKLRTDQYYVALQAR